MRRRNNELILICDSNSNSNAAREFLTSKGIRFKETTERSFPYGNRTYQVPTLLVSGQAISGLEKIKHAVIFDPRL